MVVYESLQSGVKTISAPFVFSANLGWRGVKVLAVNSQPRNKWILGVCVVAGIWTHRMAEVYAPQILCSIVVSHTVSHMGSQFFGQIFGYLVVAPSVVPTLVPIVAYALAAAMAYSVVLGGNGACYLVFGSDLKQDTCDLSNSGIANENMV